MVKPEEIGVIDGIGYTCVECGRETPVIVTGSIVIGVQIEACPKCYNQVLTEVSIATMETWHSWFPPDQFNRGEFPLLFLWRKLIHWGRRFVEWVGWAGLWLAEKVWKRKARKIRLERFAMEYGVEP